MWVATVQGHVYWLVPGRSYVVGRSKGQNVDIVVQGNAVSRQHLRITVPNVQPGSAGHPTIRTRITTTDLGSRFGTTLDNQKMPPNESMAVPQRKNAVVLVLGGTGATATLRISWRPVTITYSTGSAHEMHDALWKHACEVLEPLEVKLLPDFVHETTVFMKTGVLTSKLCYALVQQLPVVNTQYIEAIQVQLSGPDGLHHGPPDATRYSADPAYTPNPARRRCFTEQKFQCVDETTYMALYPIIEAAGGECVFSAEKPEENVLVIKPKTSTIGFDAPRIVSRDAIFAAIVSAIPVFEPEAPQRETTTRRPRRVNLLGMLTGEASAIKSNTQESKETPIVRPSTGNGAGGDMTAESMSRYSTQNISRPQSSETSRSTQNTSPTCTPRSKPNTQALSGERKRASDSRTQSEPKRPRVGKLVTGLRGNEGASHHNLTSKPSMAMPGDTEVCGADSLDRRRPPLREQPRSAIEADQSRNQVPNQVPNQSPNQSPTKAPVNEQNRKLPAKSAKLGRRGRPSKISPAPNHTTEPENTEKEEELEDLDLSNIGELAIIDYSLIVPDTPAESVLPQRQNEPLNTPSHRNFKAFRPKGHAHKSHQNDTSTSQELFVSGAFSNHTPPQESLLDTEMTTAGPTHVHTGPLAHTTTSSDSGDEFAFEFS